MITFDATAILGQVTGASESFSHTCSGNNRLLVVVVNLDNNPGQGDVLTGVTYGGVAMTLIQKILGAGTTYTNRYSYMFYLLNPASGANNIVITTSISTRMDAVSASYNGVLQSGQPDAFNDVSTANVASKTLATTIVNNNSWLVSAVISAAQTSSPSAGVTLRNGSVAGADIGIGDSNGGLAPGSHSMSWTTPAADDYMSVLNASFAPAPTPPGGFFLAAQ